MMPVGETTLCVRTARSWVAALLKSPERRSSGWREAWALFPGDVAYVWHAGLFAGAVADSLEACGFQLRSQIIWAKSNFVIGRGDYHWRHEPCWYAVREKAKGHYCGDRNKNLVANTETAKSRPDTAPKSRSSV
ncbi:hypothetical protein CCP2SC5_2440002 [Azospirillaceae bacterium]